MILVEVGGLGGCAVEIEHRQEKGDGRREEGGEGEVLQLLDLDKFPAVSYGQGYHHSLSFGAGRLFFPLLVHSHITTSVMSRIWNNDFADMRKRG
jgi:hypothetical protein